MSVEVRARAVKTSRHGGTRHSQEGEIVAKGMRVNRVDAGSLAEILDDLPDALSRHPLRLLLAAVPPVPHQEQRLTRGRARSLLDRPLRKAAEHREADPNGARLKLLRRHEVLVAPAQLRAEVGDASPAHSTARRQMVGHAESRFRGTCAVLSSFTCARESEKRARAVRRSRRAAQVRTRQEMVVDTGVRRGRPGRSFRRGVSQHPCGETPRCIATAVAAPRETDMTYWLAGRIRR